MIKVITLKFFIPNGSIDKLAHAGPYGYLIWQFCVNSSLEFTLFSFVIGVVFSLSNMNDKLPEWRNNIHFY
jgi:hypothetical protein